MKDLQKITTQNAEHYKWGDNCDGWHFLKTNSLGVIRERMPAATREQLHFHKISKQLFYILSGKARFEIGGEEIFVNAGESLYIPAGIVHKIANDTKHELEFLVISEPPSHSDRHNI